MQVTSYFLQKWENQAFNKLFFILYKKKQPLSMAKNSLIRGEIRKVFCLCHVLKSYVIPCIFKTWLRQNYSRILPQFGVFPTRTEANFLRHEKQCVRCLTNPICNNASSFELLMLVSRGGEKART